MDEDVDPFDVGAVWFSIATRVDASTEQLTVFRDLLANRQDESKARPLQVGGILIDSTKPVTRGYPEMGVPVKKALETVSLGEYLSDDVVKGLHRG